MWGPSTLNSTCISWKPLILKNRPIFLCACGYVVDLPHVAQVRFWQPKRPHSERKDMPFGNPPHHGTKNCSWPSFPPSCGYVVDWPHVAQVRFWRPKRPHLEKKDMPFGNPPHHATKTCGLSKNNLFFTFKSGILGQKLCFGVFWTECEVADLKQRQRTTAMDHKQDLMIGITHI